MAIKPKARASQPYHPASGIPVVVVGIDFGTTFSGVAHAFVPKNEARAENVLGIQSWSGSNRTWDKVPTRFAYIEEPEPAAKRARFGERSAPMITKVFKWGFELDPGDPTIECIKLLLIEDRELPEHVRRDDILSELMKHGKTIEDAITDYLREICGVVEKSLTDQYGKNRLTGTERINVITVPAIWSEAAKDATKRLAVKAGFANNILLVSEPEAAAIWTIQKTPWLDVKVGQIFIVCDAGGGTVDLIAYEITQVSPLRVKEVMTGIGGLCGASFLNRRFEQLVSDKIGTTAFKQYKKDHPERWDNAAKDFEENPKRNFNPQRDPDRPDRTFSIICPGIPNDVECGPEDRPMIKGDFIRLSTAELDKIFEPIVAEVIDLTEKQVSGVQLQGKSVAAVMLVGGFGQSKYLLGRVRAHFQSQKIDVLQPPEAWSAIARGAVLWGAEGQKVVESRKARYHYGIRLRKEFVEGKHPESSRSYDDLREKFFSINHFEAYLKKGQTVSASSPISHECQQAFTLGQSLISTSQLLISYADSTPKWCKATFPVCTLETNLQLVPERHWKSCTNSKGVKYRIIDYQLKIQLESGGLKFWLEIDGDEYSAVKVKFD